jgi:hypothetical protein
MPLVALDDHNFLFVDVTVLGGGVAGCQPSACHAHSLFSGSGDVGDVRGRGGGGVQGEGGDGGEGV